MSEKIVQLNEEVIKGHLKELVRGSVEETLNELLEKEAESLTQAARYERSEARQGYRSGHYDRNLSTTSGDVTLHMPRLKGIPFETAIIERYRRRESSVEEALIEMYLAGVSVRRVEDITEALWGTKVSPSTISELNKKAYVDCGSDDTPSRYPYYAAKVASAVSAGTADKGILICGSGIGMSIAANKFMGVRAALVSDSYSAYLTRRHNDSNVLCLGGCTSGRWTILEILDIWLNTDYDGGHHDKSLELIAELESCNFSGECWCPEERPYPDFEWDPAQKL